MCGESLTSVYMQSRFLAHHGFDPPDLAFDTDPHNSRKMAPCIEKARAIMRVMAVDMWNHKASHERMRLWRMYCSPQIKAYTPDGGETTGYEEVCLCSRLAWRCGLADFDEVRLDTCQIARRWPRRLEVRINRGPMYEGQRPSPGMVFRQGDRGTEGVECAHAQQPRRSGVSSWRGREHTKSQHTVQRPAVKSTTNDRAELPDLLHGALRRRLCCPRKLDCCLTAPPWTHRVCTAIHAMLMHTPHYTTKFYDATTITIHDYNYDAKAQWVRATSSLLLARGFATQRVMLP